MRIGRVNSAAAVIGAACMSFWIGTGALAAAPAADTPQARAAAAYQAQGMAGDYLLNGGAQAREVIVTLVTRGSMQQWDPGESNSVTDLTSPDWGTSTFVQTWDRSREMYRTEWVRPRAGGGTRTYTEIFSPEGGYVIGNDANGGQPSRAVEVNGQPAKTMSGLRLRALLREQERANIVLAMHDYPERLTTYPDQMINGKRYPAVQYYGDNDIFIVMFDPDTHYPAVVRTRDFDQLMGDANFDATLSDYRDVMGYKLPFHITYTLNGFKVFDKTIESYNVNASIPTDAFNAPAAIRGKAGPPAAINDVPFQWVLRRLASGFYLDSDALYTDDGRSLQLTDVGPNISLVTGGTHNSLIVATDNYLVAFDAPGDDGMSQKVMQLAAQKYPGKSFRYVVLTHHHIDHSGGLRAYIAAGATLVVGKGDGDFFRNVLSAPAELNHYALDGNVEPRIVEVDGKWSVSDGARTIEAHSLDNPHAAGYLIPYVADAKMGFVTDLWSPGQNLSMPNPNMVAVVRGVERMGIMPEKFAGGHGGVGNYADLVNAVGPAR